MTTPSDDAPTTRQLIRSTIIALLVAVVLLVTVVLPAEYGRDVTGIGRVLGLTEMGEIKMVLAEEAAANATALAAADSIVAASESATEAPAVAVAPASGARTDTTVVTLAAGKGIEVKLSMLANARAHYAWTASGPVNFDMHGDSANAPTGWFVSYKKGFEESTGTGELVAGFPGSHGWFWRNRGKEAVEIRLVTSGDYSKVTRP